MIRTIDFLAALFGLIALTPLLLIVTVLGFWDTKSPIFIQKRVGRNNKTFNLVKFRTMSPDTLSVATHQVSSNAITPLGHILRRTKIDELPQLFNVLLGQMSLVGPRPCLPSQEELISERTKLGVDKVRPGITGLAQIKNIDMSTPRKLAKVDSLMLKQLNICFYFVTIVQTILGAGSGDKVKPDVN